MKNLFRKKPRKSQPLKPTNIFIPNHLLPYQLEGYLQGNRVIKGEGVSINTFDVVKNIKESRCIKTGKLFLHADGYLNTYQYKLILSYRNHEAD